MKFNIIVATDIYGGIGLFDNNKYSIPWNNSIDMNFFKETTSGNKNVVIMGRNTYFSLPIKKLPNRKNIVITSKPNLIEHPDVQCFESLDNALNNHKDFDIYIIGGAKLYEEALNHKNLDKILWNIILDSKNNCNIKFPITFIEAMNKFDIDFNYNKIRSNLNVSFYKFTNKIERNIDESNYLNLLHKILINGDSRQTRNSITKSIFGEKLEFNLINQFPLLTTKKMFLRGIFEELVWFLKGQTDSKILENKNVNIWKGNTSKEFIDKMNLPYREGDVGNMYGFQLKHAGTNYDGCDINYSQKGFNQINYCLNLLKTDKYSRRIIMTTYIPHEASKGVLYPCHGIVIQFYVKEINNLNYLSCHMYQRSADMFLGVPFNIASYSLLVYMICHILNNDNECKIKFTPDKLTISFGDLHIYNDHYEQVQEQISRTPFIFPKLVIKKKYTKLEDFKWDSIQIIDYNSHNKISAKIVA